MFQIVENEGEKLIPVAKFFTITLYTNTSA